MATTNKNDRLTSSVERSTSDHHLDVATFAHGEGNWWGVLVKCFWRLLFFLLQVRIVGQ